MTLPRWLSLKPVVSADWDELTPRWATDVVRSSHPRAVVERIEVLGRDDGTNRRARIALHYAKGSGPRQLFLKAHAPAHRWVHFRNGNLWNEARLFAHKADLPIEHPRVYLAVADYPRLDFLIVMEDICLRGGDPYDARRTYTVDEVANGLRELAKLHRHYWNFNNKSDPHLRWVKDWAPSEGWQVGLKRHVPKGIERARDLLDEDIGKRSGDDLVEEWARYVRDLRRGPPTLLHGDAHIGNTYLLPGGQVGFLDWQVVRRGNWSQDVGYFLAGSLSTDDRRAHERALVDLYLEALDLPHGQAPSRDEAWHRYRMSHIYGLVIWLSTLGTEGYQPKEISRALVDRYAAACKDVDTFAALQEV